MKCSAVDSYIWTAKSHPESRIRWGEMVKLLKFRKMAGVSSVVLSPVSI